MENKTFIKHFNPYRNEKCFEYACNNIAGFTEDIENNDLKDYIEAFFDYMIADHITYYETQSKAYSVASKHYEDLYFDTFFEEIEYGIHRREAGYHINGKGFLVDYEFYAPEIEIQLDDGNYTYLNPIEKQIPIFAVPN